MSLPSSYGGGGQKTPPPSSVFGGGVGAGGGGGGGAGDKGLSMSVFQTLRLAWADPDLRQRILFVLTIFGVYALGVHIQVPIPGISPEELTERLSHNQFFQMINMYGGGALRRLSIFALGLNPYITASIILQILTQAYPQWKEELKEGGEYARQKQNRRTRLLSLGSLSCPRLGIHPDAQARRWAGNLHSIRDRHGHSFLDRGRNVRALDG